MEKPILFVRVLVTSRCNINCPECNQREWRDAGYDMTPDEVEYFLDIADQSGYIIDTMSFGAREPTMNPFLPDIIRTTRKKNVRCVQILSNGFNIEALVPVKELIDYVHLGYYGERNRDAIKEARNIFGRKVTVTVIKDHHIIVNKPTALDQPVDCCCNGIALHANKVYACAPLVNLCIRFPELEPKDHIFSEVSLHFLDKLKTRDKGGTKYCYYCTDNWSVAKDLKNIPVFDPP